MKVKYDHLDPFLNIDGHLESRFVTFAGKHEKYTGVAERKSEIGGNVMMMGASPENEVTPDTDSAPAGRTLVRKFKNEYQQMIDKL